MSYLLDTNACIHLLNNSDSPVKVRLAAARPQDVALCAIVKAELYSGEAESCKSLSVADSGKSFGNVGEQADPPWPT